MDRPVIDVPIGSPESGDYVVGVTSDGQVKRFPTNSVWTGAQAERAEIQQALQSTEENAEIATDKAADAVAAAAVYTDFQAAFISQATSLIHTQTIVVQNL